MKKASTICIIILLCLSLAGCGTAANTVTAAQLTDREKLLASAISDNAFVFEFSVDESYTSLSVWVEQYIFGKKVQNPSSKITCGVEQFGTIIVYMNPTDNTAAHPQMLNFFIQSGGGQYEQLNAVRDIEESIKDAKSGWTANGAAIPVSGNMVLGCIRFSKGGSFTVLSDEFFGDYENHLDELKKDDVTYIVRCGFRGK